MIRVTLVLEATIGGTRKHLRDAARALPASEFQVRIVCATRRDPGFRQDLDEFSRRGHEVVVLPMTRSPNLFTDARAVLALRRLLTRAPSDILHLHSAKAGLIGRIAAIALPIKVVYTPHAFPFLMRVAEPLRLAYRGVERLLRGQTYRLLAVGDDEARLARDEVGFDPTQIVVLRNAIDVATLAAEVGERESSPTPTIGFIGDLRAQKDPSTFLDAIASDPVRALGARILVPDFGPDRERIRAEVARRGLSAVEFVTSDETLASVYRQIELAVLPSRWEGLPYAHLEALGLAIPVITSDIPPLRDLSERIDPALVFPVGDASALAARIVTWLKRPPADRAEAGSRGRAIVIAEHELGTWGERLRCFYRGLVDAGGTDGKPS